MPPLRAYTPEKSSFPLPEGHRFPLYKYAGVAQALRDRFDVVDTPALPWALAEAVHDHEYLRRWWSGTVSAAEQRVFGLPWSLEVVERCRLACGGTLAATRDALELGWGINLAGGTHHAFADRAEGFCLLNDVAIATRHVLAEGLVRRVLVLDLDVHQGNGTARLLAKEPRAFTLSVHGERNYPFRKERSDLDIGLPDGVTDDDYLAVLATQVIPAVAAFQPQLVFFLAGVDVLAGDRFGRFALTLDGIRRRSEAVLGWCFRAGVPLVSVMAGGYNRDHAQTVRAHALAVSAGSALFVRR